MTSDSVTVVRAADSENLQRRMAGGLAAEGLSTGDRIVTVLPGSAASLALALGALRTGIVVVPLDPSLTSYERGPLIADADPALVVDSEAELDRLSSARPIDLADFPLSRPMHYTSGTTGRPKGVYSGVLDETAARALAMEEREQWGIDDGDRHLVTSPMHHSAPLRFATTTLLAGGDVLLAGRFDPERWLEAVARHRPTTSFVVPAHLQRLLSHQMPSLSSFRLLAHAGAPCPDHVKRWAIEAFPRDSVWEFYGATEGQFTTCSTQEWESRPGTVGRARPGRQLRVTNGQIWCRVPDHARFVYWRDEEKTAAAWRGEEFTVGDMGRLDPDGYLYIDGRRVDLVISGGVNVYPAEVESVLSACPGVAEVAVFGRPDPRWGQRVCAAFVGDATESTLRSWAREHLAPAKRPKEYQRVGSLPRTTTGKLLRRALGV